MPDRLTQGAVPVCSELILLAQSATSRFVRSILRQAALACLLLVATSVATAQQMAHPGWVGSGIAPDPWWKHAVFFQINPQASSNNSFGNPSQSFTSTQDQSFKELAARMDSLHTLGVDALLLPMPPMPDASNTDANLDDFDELLHQASLRNIRVLITFPVSDVTADLPSIARFWLSRGVAGFRLVIPTGTSPQYATVIEQTLRKITASEVGARIVLSDFKPDAPAISPQPMPTIASQPSNSTGSNTANSQPNHSARRRGRRRSAGLDTTDSGAQLQIDPRLSQLELPEAANLRPILAQSLLKQNILLDFSPLNRNPDLPDPYPALEHAMATILLATHSAAMIDPALADKSLADWTAKLSALHHGNPTLRNGSITLLDFDRQNALVWIVRPAQMSANAPAIVVACNLSSLPLRLSLASAVHGLNLRGSYLLTLLRSDAAMGAQDLDSLTLPPFAVYIGELHR
jgi:alpha-glucosidase